jgi:LacI family transcriptional regulator
MTNLREIAQRVGFSKSTVSLALLNHPSIPSVTRERIKKMARRLHYMPNQKVSMIMSAISRHTTTKINAPIALLSMWPARNIWKDPTHNLRRFYEGCTSRAAEFGYKIEEFWLNSPGMTPTRMQNILSARGIECILVFCYPTAPARVELDLEPFASVALGRAIVSPRIYSVDHDHHQGLLLALDMVAKRGYGRPGLVISHDAHERTMHCWAAAFRFAMSLLDKQDQIPPWIQDDSDLVGLEKWAQRYRPDVLLINDNRTIQLVRSSKSELIRRMKFASLFLCRSSDGIAGIDTLDERQGARAIELLVEQVRNNRRGLPNAPETVLLDGIWRDGDSLPDLSGQ